MRRFQKAKQEEIWEEDFLDSPDENQQEEEEKGNVVKSREHWLTVIQIAVCFIVLLAALCIKYFGGELYTTLRNWYVEHINQSILTEDDLKNLKQQVWDVLPAGEETSSDEETAGSSSQGEVDGASSAISSDIKGEKENTAASEG